MRFALIKFGVVENIAIAEQEFIESVADQWTHAVPLSDDSSVAIGWSYDAATSAFARPPVVEQVVTVSTKITRLAFLNRFTDEEAIGIDLASQGATVPAATIRRYLSKVNEATYIDLSDASLISGVRALEASGLIAAGRADAITNLTIAAGEAYTG